MVRSVWAFAHSSWGSSTSRPTRSPTAGDGSTRRGRWPRTPNDRRWRHILDVGGESTRPARTRVPADEELRRVLPVVEALAQRTRAGLDRHLQGARGALGARAGRDDRQRRQRPVVRPRGCRRSSPHPGVPIVLMHIRGRPADDVSRRGLRRPGSARSPRSLGQAVGRASAAGIPRELTILIDPGLGFAKRAEQTWDPSPALTGWPRSDRPLVVGPSRKSFIDVRPRVGDRRAGAVSATGPWPQPSPRACSAARTSSRRTRGSRDGRRGARRGSPSDGGHSALS